MPLVLFGSCGRSKVLHEYADVDMWRWANTDTVSFELPRTVRQGRMDAMVGVRYTQSYPYHVLHLQAIICRDGKHLQTDTLFIPMFNERGEPLGDGFPYLTATQPLPVLHVDSGHTYTYHISHTMKEPAIAGIGSVGLEIDLR